MATVDKKQASTRRRNMTEHTTIWRLNSQVDRLKKLTGVERLFIDHGPNGYHLAQFMENNSGQRQITYHAQTKPELSRTILALEEFYDAMKRQGLTNGRT